MNPSWGLCNKAIHNYEMLDKKASNIGDFDNQSVVKFVRQRINGARNRLKHLFIITKNLFKSLNSLGFTVEK